MCKIHTITILPSYSAKQRGQLVHNAHLAGSLFFANLEKMQPYPVIDHCNTLTVKEAKSSARQVMNNIPVPAEVFTIEIFKIDLMSLEL